MTKDSPTSFNERFRTDWDFRKVCSSFELCILDILLTLRHFEITFPLEHWSVPNLHHGHELLHRNPRSSHIPCIYSSSSRMFPHVPWPAQSSGQLKLPKFIPTLRKDHLKWHLKSKSVLSQVTHARWCKYTCHVDFSFQKQSVSLELPWTHGGASIVGSFKQHRGKCKQVRPSNRTSGRQISNFVPATTKRVVKDGGKWETVCGNKQLIC